MQLRVRPRAHSDFDPTLVGLAIALALAAGLVPAIAMAGAIGGLWPVGSWWSALRQIHGHVQLFGWVALFVLGTGSFFLPRARGAALAWPAALPWIAVLLGGGVLLRAFSQLGLTLSPASGNPLLRVLFAASGISELAGVMVAIVLFGTTFAAGPPLAQRPHLRAVIPLLAAAFASLLLATVLSAIGAVRAAMAGAPLLDARLDRFVVELMIFGFALPATQAVSAQTFPLFLRLPAPGRAPLSLFAAAYLASLVCWLTGLASGMRRVEVAGASGIAIALLAFTLLLDVLTRWRTPWVAAKIPAPANESRRPTRPGLPDRGEYGRFEWLIYSAYFWQALGAILVGLNGVADLIGRDPFVSPDAARHSFTLGFVTILIFGMAVRMLPGFARTRLAGPAGVAVLAAIANAATACRVLPLLTGTGVAGERLVGISGFLAWAAIALLGAMLAVTWRRACAARVAR